MKNLLLFTVFILSSTIFNSLHAQESIGINYSSTSTDPLYIVDGKEIDSFALNSINPDDIESMSVFKGDDAINRYGAKGKNGVIVVITKNAPLEITSKPKSEIRINSKGLGIPDPIYVLNGVEISKSDLEKLDKDTIEKMLVLKGDEAINKYGNKAKNGVIEIYTKK